MSETEIRRYRFGPLERRGLIGSLRATQVIPMAASLARRRRPDADAAERRRALRRARARPRRRRLLLLAGQRAVRRRVAADRRCARAGADVSGRHRRLSVAPDAGARANDGPGVRSRSSRFPMPVAGPRAARSAVPTARPSGCVKDARAKTYTAVLAVRVTSFGLLDRAEQETQAGRLGRRSRRVSPARERP